MNTQIVCYSLINLKNLNFNIESYLVQVSEKRFSRHHHFRGSWSPQFVPKIRSKQNYLESLLRCVILLRLSQKYTKLQKSIFFSNILDVEANIYKSLPSPIRIYRYSKNQGIEGLQKIKFHYYLTLSSDSVLTLCIFGTV